MINYTATAAAHGIAAQALDAEVALRGWDFSSLEATDKAVEFVGRVVDGIAANLAATAAKIEVRRVALEVSQPQRTTRAAANPSSVCGKCDGTGKVWATWVANGVCFQCKGVGALRCAS